MTSADTTIDREIRTDTETTVDPGTVDLGADDVTTRRQGHDEYDLPMPGGLRGLV